jgi:DnaJ-class molecular chaperone
MQRKDYYGILGVARDADEAEIKVAYRRLALLHHPDTNSDDPEAEGRFKEIHEAYDFLIHREKRDRYDLGRGPLVETPRYRPPIFDSFEESCYPGGRCRGGGFARIFSRRRRAFGEASSRRVGAGPYPSDPHVHDLPLTSEEAVKGTERDIRLHTGRDTLVFTLDVPAGLQNGTLIRLKRMVGNGEIEFHFRVKIADRQS